MIFVNVGQCGNQLGHCILDKLYTIMHDTGCCNLNSTQRQDSDFFRFSRNKGKFVARALAIDTERKVIQSFTPSTGGWIYASTCTFQSGAGNNWAQGYMQYGESTFERIRDKLKKEIYSKTCTICILHSLSGGSGSGLGAYLTERIRSTYPDNHIVNIVVWPYQSGEVVTQSYNTVLSLAKITRACDQIIVLFNDHLHKIVQISSGRTGGGQGISHHVTVSDLNRVASEMLISLFLCRKSQLKLSFKDLLQKTCPKSSSGVNDKNLKILTVSSSFRFEDRENKAYVANRAVTSARHVEAEIRNTLCSDRPSMKCVSGALIFNEMSDSCFKEVDDFCRKSFKLTVASRNLTLRMNTSNASCVTLVLNSSFILSPIGKTMDKVLKLWHLKAYWHHYSRFGLQPTEMNEAIEVIKKLSISYKLLELN